MKIIAGAVWSAAVIRKKIHEGTIFAQQARKLKVQADFLEHASEKAKIAVDEVVDTEALAIAEKYFRGGEMHEEVARLKNTLRTLASLLERGAEVHPSLMAPEQAKELFPDFKALDTVSSKIPQIADTTPATNPPS